MAFAIRQALLQPSAEDAVRFLESVTHASGQSYIVADRDEVIGLEADADGTSRVPAKADGAVVHTNHAIVRDARDRDESLAAAALANTTNRLDALQRADTSTTACITAALSAAPLRRVPTEALPGVTFATVVFELGDEPRAQVRGGPGENEFLTVERVG